MYPFNIFFRLSNLKENDIIWLDLTISILSFTHFRHSSIVINQFQGYSEVADDTDKTIKEEEKVYLPLGEGVLDSNLGIPLIVVGTKVTEFSYMRYNNST